MFTELPAQSVTRGVDRTWRVSLVGDWIASAPRSEWARRVNDHRIVHQDRIRPYATRGLLLLGVIGCLAVADGPRATWWLFLVAAVQTGLELLYEPATRARHESVARRTRPGRWIIRVYYWNYQHGITNVTGLVGLAACVANIYVVTYGSGPAGDLVWVKVVALAGAVMYAASGALGPLLDTAAYDPGSRVASWMWHVLRVAWVGVAALIAVAVVGSDRTDGAWGDALPYALLTVAIAYYPMLRVREYERVLIAGARVAQQHQAHQNLALARDLHHLLQPVKGTLQKARDSLADPADRAAVNNFLDDMEHVYRAARERRIDDRDGLIRPLEPRLQQVAEASLVALETDLRLQDFEVDADYRLAKQCLITFVENSVQAYALWRGPQRPWVGATAWRAENRIVVEVVDLLPRIPDETWARLDTTLGWLRADVEKRGGTVEQVTSTEGKVVRATWPPDTEIRVAVTEGDGER